VLFSPVNAEDAGGTTLPIAAFSLTLDDELQYRCAGYIQAEIERYAEFLDDSGEDEEDSQGSERSEEEDGIGEGDNATTPTKPRRTKKVRKEGMCKLHAPRSGFHLNDYVQPNWIHETYWKENSSSSMSCRRFYEPSAQGQFGFNMELSY
jgi:hypothetical protein